MATPKARKHKIAPPWFVIRCDGFWHVVNRREGKTHPVEYKSRGAASKRRDALNKEWKR